MRQEAGSFYKIKDKEQEKKKKENIQLAGPHSQPCFVGEGPELAWH